MVLVCPVRRGIRLSQIPASTTPRSLPPSKYPKFTSMLTCEAIGCRPRIKNTTVFHRFGRFQHIKENSQHWPHTIQKKFFFADVEATIDDSDMLAIAWFDSWISFRIDTLVDLVSHAVDMLFGACCMSLPLVSCSVVNVTVFRGRHPGLINHVLTVLVIRSCVLATPHLPGLIQVPQSVSLA